MKRLIYSLLFPVIIIPVFSLPVCGSETMFGEPEKQTLKPLSEKVLRPDEVLKKLDGLRGTDKNLQILGRDLEEKGYRPQKESKNLFGIESTYSNDQQEKVVITLYIQDYMKENSGDLAGLCRLSLSEGKTEEVYSFYLIAPEGDFQKAMEFSVDKDMKISERNGWWSCYKNYSKQRCIASKICIIYTRSRTWAPYIANVALTCQHCFILGSLYCMEGE